MRKSKRKLYSRSGASAGNSFMDFLSCDRSVLVLS